MEQNQFTSRIAQQLQLSERSVGNTIELLNDGATIPFIARYRKERTGSLDEVQIAQIGELYQKFQELQKRKETILKTIEEQGKLTPELKKRIEETWESSVLEDIYLPYRPKRRTKAQVAREHGLEPLAKTLLMQREGDIDKVAQRYVNADVSSIEDALQGAKDIIAEMVSEDERSRHQLRGAFRRQAVITSKVVKAKAEEEGAAKFSDYFDWSEPLKRCSSHRLLAMRRGEAEGFLRVSISPNEDEGIENLKSHYVRGKGKCSELVGEAVADAYKRLLKPSIETEFATLSKEKADEECIKVFAENLRQLLLSPPLGEKRVMGIDPGFRTGCKVVCLDAQGNLLHYEAIYPHPPQSERVKAVRAVERMVEAYKIEAIAIGNGTASRETASFVERLHLGDEVQAFVVSEDGASVYSASKLGREEFPEYDVTVRGAVSIGRRLMDPLAELVKIDPKSIGVGQYQHDVDQGKLKQKLDQTVESCVNAVGVDLNTASQHLLTYVSGLGPQLAKNIVDYRREHGAFTSRAQLLKVPRLGPAAFQQCAGFLRIRGAENPLDNSAVHPERYALVERMAKEAGCTVTTLMTDAEKRSKIDVQQYVTAEVGLPTLTDIMKELEKPGRDPRAQIEVFKFDERVNHFDDLHIGMELPGIVTNITRFGAFVDVGVHQDGLVHVSQLANRYVSDPNDVVRLHQHVRVRVIELDEKRHRIAFTMRGVEQ
ncbi:MAG: Tex family protein [Bacteroidales bacterium]|nr:RNA-binding transcriptional accessory protein [Bacteroidaceae bacterium]MDO4185413.1 Tex family protein [Bacteroidales bacterium]